MTNEFIGTYDTLTDSHARERALASLGDLLKSPLTMDRLNGWVSEAVGIRSPFLQDRVFGKIRWKRSGGRSLGPTLATIHQIIHPLKVLAPGRRYVAAQALQLQLPTRTVRA